MMFETSLDSFAPQHAERRRHPRCKVAVQLELHPQGMAAPFRTTTSDVSPGGCYVETMFTLEVGTELKIKLWLDSVTLSTTGIVTTRHPQVGHGRGEAIRKLTAVPRQEIKVIREKQRLLARPADGRLLNLIAIAGREGSP